jgi:hypothetical protein
MTRRALFFLAAADDKPPPVSEQSMNRLNTSSA